MQFKEWFLIVESKEEKALALELYEIKKLHLDINNLLR